MQRTLKAGQPAQICWLASVFAGHMQSGGKCCAPALMFLESRTVTLRKHAYSNILKFYHKKKKKKKKMKL